MAKYALPKHPGKFSVQTAYAGNYIVTNDKTGKRNVIIACRNKTHADELCEKLNKGDHKGHVWVRFRKSCFSGNSVGTNAATFFCNETN